MAIFHPQLEFQPEKFDDILGQPYLKVATTKLQKGQISPLYLLTGPNGTGKTVTAKILTRAILCEALDGYNPCGQCPSCTMLRQLPEHQHPDVIWTAGPYLQKAGAFEEIKEQLYYPPSRSYRVIVIDEAAVLPPSLRNSLLVLTEDPTVHRYGNVFMLVTMQPDAFGREMLGALSGRSTHLRFSHVSLTSMGQILERVVQGLVADAVNSEIITMLTLAANGSVRQGLQLLDAAYALDPNLSATAVMIVTQVLPRLNRYHIWTLLDANNYKALKLFITNECAGAVANPELFYRSLLLDIDAVLTTNGSPDLLNAVALLYRAMTYSHIDPVIVVYQLQPYASLIRKTIEMEHNAKTMVIPRQSKRGARLGNAHSA